MGEGIEADGESLMMWGSQVEACCVSAGSSPRPDPDQKLGLKATSTSP